MAHLNDLNNARAAVEKVEDPYQRTIAMTQVAIASAFTDIAAAIEDISNSYYKSVR